MKQIHFILLILFLTASFSCEKKVENEKVGNVKTDNQQNKFNKQNESPKHLKPPENLSQAMKAVEPFFELMGEPKPDEWLSKFKENGQTFEEYINGNPVLPTKERQNIYVQPIGKFNNKQLEIVQLTAEYMQSFFGLPVKLLPEKKFKEPLSVKNYRVNPSTKKRQIRTGYIFNEILKPNLPKDAAALIAFTDEDLFLEKNSRYVFGQASLENRVGVWSLFRLDDYANFEQFLKRTLKVAVHETGHMFSFAHCTKYECVMSGSNHLGELYRHPIDACPECMAKISWMSGYDAKKRYENLAEFCRKHNLKKDFEEFMAKAKAVGKN